MRVAVTGAGGLVGSRLLPILAAAGHEVLPLVRPESGRAGVPWSPERGLHHPPELVGTDALVHLAGANIAAGRWTPARKEAIRQSRVLGTRHLARDLATLDGGPRILVCASAVGYYGDRGEEELDEDSPPGRGFLAEVCQEWEAAAATAREAGLRVVHLRIGMVLSGRGGALRRMLLPFRVGLGGPLGSGRQWLSWISLDDLAGIVLRALAEEDLAGALNAVAPEPVRQRDFARALGRALGRPAVLPAPAPLLRLALGEMARELLLASTRVRPRRLAARQHDWRHPGLAAALAAALDET